MIIRENKGLGGFASVARVAELVDALDLGSSTEKV